MVAKVVLSVVLEILVTVFFALAGIKMRSIGKLRNATKT
jgi:hypothetical protein